MIKFMYHYNLSLTRYLVSDGSDEDDDDEDDDDETLSRFLQVWLGLERTGFLLKSLVSTLSFLRRRKSSGGGFRSQSRRNVFALSSSFSLSTSPWSLVLVIDAAEVTRLQRQVHSPEDMRSLIAAGIELCSLMDCEGAAGPWKMFAHP
ncbi:unnamed protein product [Pleuronectes platessa]|uniref:Uncharacterized protein n=1 Tax=Pleuronectes platessa TaxID=8262 RepID=A0A9N7VF40_PLEPL|nr:unnamed protein product [Pleuronectes platessa]